MLEILKILLKLVPFCKIVINGIHKCESSKYASLIKAIIILVLLPSITYLTIIKNNHYEKAKADNIINLEIFSAVKACGINNFITWIVIDDNILSLKKRRFVFKEAIGCLREKENCGASIKEDNFIYSEEHLINDNDYHYLNDLKDGQLISYKIKDGVIKPNFKNQYIPDILSKMILLTNFPLKDVRFVVVKDFKRSIVYIFTMSFALNSEPTCSSQTANILLDNISRKARENL